MSKVKLERLLNLMALLIETSRPLTAEEIRNRVAGYPEGGNPFRQAFERDKRDLRDIGIPLTVVDQAPGAPTGIEGYRIHKRDYYLADPGLDADELAALHLAGRAVRLEGMGSHDALLKLEGATRADVVAGTGPPAGDPDLELAALPARDDLGDLFGAVAACRPVQFTYGGRERTVDPYRLDFQRGRWYLNGFDHGRHDERVFRLDRIQDRITVLAGPVFERPDLGEASGPGEPWLLGDGEPVTARLAVDGPQAPWIIGHLGADTVVERRDDGGVVMELTVTNRDSFRSFVLIFLDQAEILGPPELRDEMVAWLSKLAEGSDK